MNNKDYLESFQDHMEENEKSEGTIKGYMSDINAFLEFVGKNIQEVKRSDVKAYKEELKARKLKVQTINRKLVGIKQFIDFLNEQFNLGISAKVKQEKTQRQYSLKDEELLEEEDYKKLMAEVNKAGDIRTKAMFEAMYYSGMRVSEMLQLRMDHVGKKIVEDIKGKGGKYRDIYMSDKLQESLEAYLTIRKQPYSSVTKVLFVGQRGPISRQTVHNLMKGYAEKAGIPLKKAHAHNLRHLFGLRLAKKGVPIEDIAKFMGHTSIDVTKIYLEKTQSYYANLIDEL